MYHPCLNFSVDSLFPSSANLMNTPDSLQYTIPCRPIPLPSLLYFSFFLCLTLRPWSTHCEPFCPFIFQDHARSLFLFLSLCYSYKLTEIMTSALYLSISRPSSILAPLLHVTQHIPDYQFRATNSFKTILNIFCICKILLFTGEAMAAESSHRKKMNKGREPTIRIKKKKKKTSVLPLCNTDVYAPDSLPPGTRYEKAFLQHDPNKIWVALSG